MKYTAIIVDDEKIVRDGLIRHFDWGKYSVNIAGSFCDGEDAWRYLQSHNADIIVTDVRMPRMDGISLAAKALERSPDTCIIFISAYSDIAYLKDALKLGAVDYILKSIDLKELAAAVERTIERVDRVRINKAEHDAIITEKNESQNASGNKEKACEFLLQSKYLPKGIESAAILKARNIIDSKYMDQITVASIAEDVNLTQAYLCVLFKSQAGMTINDYLTRVRIEHAKALLIETQMKLYEVCEKVGYLSPAYFTRLFRKYTGMTPKEWRDRNV